MKVTVVSDIHVNSYFSKKDRFLSLLENMETDLLVLNGDIFDLYVGVPDSIVFEKIKNNPKIKDTAYINGNHDDWIKNYLPDLKTQNFLEIGDVLIHHGHLKDFNIPYKHGFFSKYLVVARNWAEKIIHKNLRLFIKKITFGYLDKCLFKQQIYTVEKYPSKKVIIGHTHLPSNNPPYYNSGCMVDDHFSYIEVTFENGVGTINLISENP